ncbi:adenylate/guanylate cyclase domain-containing protein [Microvirga aerophila]|uniref:Adenylate cyclase n=1 Tax=Microvirga aerophila TaxID=670291 RepID=A0A512BYD6_9HYPH|nr:adenylate/guanylate cyclase domain-containing protein [Microvirga aerophila]GEO16969.1 adenylate cyclase [Microvirga aerophila]
MQWPASLDYGTQRYPAHVARRLKVLNATTWCGVLLAFGFALSDLLDRRLWPLAMINIVVGLLLAAVPLMHRFGETAGALAYGLISYTAIFVICFMLGTDSGMQVQYLAIAAGAVLVFGPERIGLIALFGSVGIVLFIALELLAPADTGLLSPSFMLGNFLACIIGTSAILLAIVFYAVRETSRAEALAQREYRRSETLLANIMPVPVAERLKISPGIIADGFDDASILFADMAGFTARASGMPPMEVIRFLNEAFTAFDQLVEQHGLEKIKTTGDGYMVVSGIPLVRSDHLEALAAFALEMREVAASIAAQNGDPVAIRIGMACGPVVAGVVGTHKFFYDVWGDAVNMASRMESTGVSGQIQASQEVYERLAGQFIWEPRGTIDVKGKGRMPTWFLIDRHEAAEDGCFRELES